MNLPIIDIDEKFDFQKRGNYNNYNFGLFAAPSDNVLSFQFFVEGGETITEFEAKKIKIVNDDVEVLENIDLISDVEIVEEGSGFYYFNGNTILSSNLEPGLYYYYITDDTFERKSEIFCIKNDIELGLTGLIFEILTGMWTDTYQPRDVSGNNFNYNNGFFLKQGRCMESSNPIILKPQKHFDLSGAIVGCRIDDGYNNFATGDIIDNEIHLPAGKIYNISITFPGASLISLIIPCIENHNYIYDVTYGERFITNTEGWGIQNQYFWRGGMQTILNNGNLIYIPYNSQGGVQYNDTQSVVTNRWQPAVDYTLNEIVWYDYVYYKCLIAHTSDYFPGAGIYWQTI